MSLMYKLYHLWACVFGPVHDPTISAVVNVAAKHFATTHSLTTHSSYCSFDK